MIFQHTYQAVLDKRKTQTRRLIKPKTGHKIFAGYLNGKDVITAIVSAPISAMQQGTARTLYEVGKTYAIQPARGKKAIGRIRLLSIKQEDVRCISGEDVKAEGFEHRLDFLSVWCFMHDKECQFKRVDDSFDGTWSYDIGSKTTGLAGLADDLCMYSYLAARPNELYQAWALTFEKVA